MKKAIFSFSFIFFFLLSNNLKAQWVTLPDTGFVNFLSLSGFSSALNGFQFDTTDSWVTTVTSLSPGSGPSGFYIKNLTGIEYFDSLKVLDCYGSQLNFIPRLPNRLTYLNVDFCPIKTLPALPNCLETLYCHVSGIRTLPVLPYGLTYLDCTDDSLQSLPSLPSNLKTLICFNNQLLNLPQLPLSLTLLNCSYNKLSILPTLPTTLSYLKCSYNQITSFSSFPNSLKEIDCSYNQNLTCLPDLNLLKYIYIDSTAISCLPNYGNLQYVPTLPLCNTPNLNNCPPHQNCISYYSTDYDTTLNTFFLTVDTFVTSKVAVSYSWDFGDGIVSNASAPNHVYSIDTTFRVCLKIKTALGDSCTYCHTIGKDYQGNITKNAGFNLNVKNQKNLSSGNNLIKTVQSLSIQLSPNPCHEKLQIVFNKQIANIVVVNLLGQKQIFFVDNENSRNIQLNINSLSSGLYWIQITDIDGSVVTSKFVKE